MPKSYLEILRAAYAADNHYRSELIRVYGYHQVSDARYFTNHTDPALKAAAQAKMDADLAFHNAWLANAPKSDPSK